MHVRAIVRKYPERDSILTKKGKAEQKKLVPFKLVYCADAVKLRISHTLQKHLIILDEGLRNRFRFLVCFKTSANLFRLRYRHGFL